MILLKTPKSPLAYAVQCENLFAKLKSEEYYYVTLKIKQNNEDDFAKALIDYGKQYNVCVILVNLTIEDELDLCFQTIISVKDEMRNDNKLVEICSSIIVPQTNFGSRFMDSIWNEMVAHINSIGKCLFVFMADSNYLSLITKTDINRLYNSHLRQRNEVRYLFLVRNDISNEERSEKLFKLIKNISFEELNQQNMLPTIYISHHWGESDELVSNIQALLHKDGISYSIDTKDATYGVNIRQYENALAHNDAVIAVIDEGYLKSLPCMYELAKIFDSGEAGTRLLIILNIADDNVFRSDEKREEVRQYWEGEYQRMAFQLQSTTGADASFDVRKVNDITLILRHINKMWVNFNDQIYARGDALETEAEQLKLIDAIKSKFGESLDASQNVNAADTHNPSSIPAGVLQIGNNNKNVNIGTINGNVQF